MQLSKIPGSLILTGKEAFKNRCSAAVAVGIPALATLVSVPLLITEVLPFGWSEFAIFAFMYTITGLGVTIGLHRLFSHRSFETGSAIQALLGVCGIMALQGNITGWVATHRRHHRFSDHHGDPHSPVRQAQSGFGATRSLFYVHFGRLFLAEDTSTAVYAPDLCSNPVVRVVDRLALLWIFLSFALPTAAGWSLGGGLRGAAAGLIWGGLVRIFVGQNVGSCVNSICHMFGKAPFKTADASKNNLWVGIAAFGEGWHNNHHAFPTSARQGLRWWQLDLSYAIIALLRTLGLVRNVKIPTLAMLQEKRI